MNDEMKKILSRFLLVSVMIACFTLFGAGSLTAKQRSEYNSYRTEYAVLTLKTAGSTINLNVSEKNYSVDLSLLQVPHKVKDMLWMTPLSCFLFLGECIFDIFSH
ncbi:MAG: hypothetical protein IJW86_10495 [Clostridia bacterium]|nr:hypothetical protein [Clostridia bacterium]